MSDYLFTEDFLKSLIDLNHDCGDWGWDDETVDHWPDPTPVNPLDLHPSQDCISPKLFAPYRKAFLAGKELSEILVVRHAGRLIVYDGHHRACAAADAGLTTIMASIRDI